MTVSYTNNIISIKSNPHPVDLRRICSALYNVIQGSGWKDVILDFSQCDRVSERVMLPLIPIIVQYREREKINFKLHEPDNDQLRRLFVNANWGHYINPQKYTYKLVPYEGGHVPASRYDDQESESELHRQVMDLVLGSLQVDQANLKVVEWSLWEIMNNVSNHAESSVGGFVQATAFHGTNRVEFVVADAGIGIPASMKERDHPKALRDAISEGITKDKQNNAGNGLYGSYQAATISGGQFELNSYHGHLFQSGMENSKSENIPVPYEGTSVRCAIGLSDPELLNKALRFKGKAHDPYSVYLNTFENESEEMIFNMKKKAAKSFGSRAGGTYVRVQIENLLRDGDRIVLDFDGVGVISSSFADEVFGRLFVAMGFRAFTRRIEMRHVDPTVDGLIDRAIEQRIKLGNGNSDPSG